ncbi:uncharacterized protein LOC119592013 [Penaeus monodon]|uniref:uncharacterized protein LOC119592013 n=1 Tax=Penaeus monodon TaxID=6687 RepID=UPI0018A7AA1D|nr:uncharacterized protein LOC119592013 [Penaeus monodon]
MERRLKLKSLKRVYSQKVQGSEKKDVGLRSPGAPKKALGKSLSLDWRLPLGNPTDTAAVGLQRIDELDLSSSQHLCRSATCPSVPNSDAMPSPFVHTPTYDDSARNSPAPSSVTSLEDGAATPVSRPHDDYDSSSTVPTTPCGNRRPNRGLRRTRSRPEGPAPSFGPRAAAAAAAIGSGGSVGSSVGGTIKRYVSLLRSRSAVSHRERPNIGRISPGKHP